MTRARGGGGEGSTNRSRTRCRGQSGLGFPAPGEAGERGSQRRECHELQAAQRVATAVGRRRCLHSRKRAKTPCPQMCRRGCNQTVTAAGTHAGSRATSACTTTPVRAMISSPRLDERSQTPALAPEICHVVGEAGRTSARNSVQGFPPKTALGLFEFQRACFVFLSPEPGSLGIFLGYPIFVVSMTCLLHADRAVTWLRPIRF